MLIRLTRRVIFAIQNKLVKFTTNKNVANFEFLIESSCLNLMFIEGHPGPRSATQVSTEMSSRNGLSATETPNSCKGLESHKIATWVAQSRITGRAKSQIIEHGSRKVATRSRKVAT